MCIYVNVLSLVFLEIWFKFIPQLDRNPTIVMVEAEKTGAGRQIMF